MSPTPSTVHQKVFGKFLSHRQIPNPCKIYGAPFDVHFPTISKDDSDVYTVLQPDICVICDNNELDHRSCSGAPDLVVEILSPRNNKKELLHKYEVYQEFGYPAFY